MMVLFFAFLIALGPILAVSSKRELVPACICGVLLAVGARHSMPRLAFKKVHPLPLLLLLSGLCLLVKGAWIWRVPIEPLVDYETYFEYAKALSGSFHAPNRYVALFPHIFGYSWFLSFFIRLFGAGALLAPIINVLFSVLSGIFLFKITYRLLDVRAAVFSYLLWIFCPSQTIYNSLVFADLFYTTMLLGFLYILTCFGKRAALFGILAGCLLRFVNITRPIAAIALIAVCIWLLILKAEEWKAPAFRKKWAMFLTVLIACYAVTGQMWTNYMEKRLGEAPAAIPGYSLMVGFNMKALGTWNIVDSMRLSHYSEAPGGSAAAAQAQMLRDMRTRLSSNEMHLPRLLKHKFITFLGADDAAVAYHHTVLPDTEGLFTALCNIFYYTVVCLALFSVPALYRHARKTSMAVVLLYSIGLILAQMLIEVAGRYHYSLLPMLIIAAQYGLFYESKE